MGNSIHWLRWDVGRITQCSPTYIVSGAFSSPSLLPMVHLVLSTHRGNSAHRFFPHQGYLVLTGALEISSRSIVSGSVRLCYAIIYALFLGFGLAIGLEIFIKITGISADSFATDYTCSSSHDAGKWYRATASEWWGA